MVRDAHFAACDWRLKMKAIRVHQFGGPEVLKLEDVPTPRPSAGQVLVRIHAAGVNPYDTYMRAGTYAVKPTLPYTPGSDGAGVVEAIGDSVNKVKRGDRVYTARAPMKFLITENPDIRKRFCEQLVAAEWTSFWKCSPTLTSPTTRNF